jgi:uncharacterized protein (DUF433 family)
MGGVPCFAGTRVPIQNLIDYCEYTERGVEIEDSINDFLDEFPSVTRDQVMAFLKEKQTRDQKFALLGMPWGKLKEWLKFLGWSVTFILASHIGVRELLETSQRHLPLVLHLMVAGFWALFILGSLFLITGERGKKWFRDVHVKFGVLWPPFLYSLWLLGMAASVFASISVTLQHYGFTTFEPRLPEELSPVVNFYIWHFLDSVPGLQIPQTLKWAQPYQYSDRLSGFVVLVFKIAVIVPVIGSFVLWKNVREGAVAARTLKEQRKQKQSRKPTVPTPERA